MQFCPARHLFLWQAMTAVCPHIHQRAPAKAPRLKPHLYLSFSVSQAALSHPPSECSWPRGVPFVRGKEAIWQSEFHPPAFPQSLGFELCKPTRLILLDSAVKCFGCENWLCFTGSRSHQPLRSFWVSVSPLCSFFCVSILSRLSSSPSICVFITLSSFLITCNSSMPTTQRTHVWDIKGCKGWECEVPVNVCFSTDAGWMNSYPLTFNMNGMFVYNCFTLNKTQ